MKKMESDIMKNLINKLKQNTRIVIKEKEYLVKTKTWYRNRRR